MDIPHGTPSGYSWHKCRCEVCVDAKRQRDRDYYLRNAEARKAKAAEWYAENREQAAESRRRYNAAHADEIAAKKREEYLANPEVSKARVRQWKTDNPERAKANAARHREKHRAERRAADLARYYRLMAEDPERIRASRRAWAKTKKGVLYHRAADTRRRGVAYTPEALEWIASLVDPVCAYCGRMAAEIDHIIPISRGGTGDKDNLVPACRSCNARKSNMTLAEFIAKKG